MFFVVLDASLRVGTLPATDPVTRVGAYAFVYLFLFNLCRRLALSVNVCLKRYHGKALLSAPTFIVSV